MVSCLPTKKKQKNASHTCKNRKNARPPVSSRSDPEGSTEPAIGQIRSECKALWLKVRNLTTFIYDLHAVLCVAFTSLGSAKNPQLKMQPSGRRFQVIKIKHGKAKPRPL